MFQRYFDAGLAQASYLLACDRTRDAVVIDPRRDVDIYAAAAAQSQLRIIAAIETHIHADFVSGARELAATGATIFAGPGSSLKFPAREVVDNERFVVGDLILRFLHTPGHTPEHISILAEHPAEPMRVFTGDTLFVGAVGRPDLLGEAMMRRLAGQLHDSLFERLLTLDDGVEIHPGHGAGSLCGAGIGTEPFSTIGRERRANPMLAHGNRDEFIAAVLEDLPETPPYFSRMKRANRDGPDVLGFARGYAGVRELALDAAASAFRDGAIPIDLREADAFCAGHVAGSLHMAFGQKIGYWCGWVLPENSRVLFMTSDPSQAAEAGRQLLRVGFDRIEGYVLADTEAWRAGGFNISRIKQITGSELRRQLDQNADLVLVDVRTAHEWASGHVAGALHVPMNDVASRAAELDRRSTIATICEHGYRSSLAASLLARAGLPDVMTVTGGMSAYRATIEAIS
jgi:hydroxyacylglutathione hydrolase